MLAFIPWAFPAVFVVGGLTSVRVNKAVARCAARVEGPGLWYSKRPVNMKMIAEYLEHALHFERMAAEASDSALKESLRKQAVAYRKLATERAERSVCRGRPDHGRLTPTSLCVRPPGPPGRTSGCCLGDARAAQA